MLRPYPHHVIHALSWRCRNGTQKAFHGIYGQRSGHHSYTCARLYTGGFFYYIHYKRKGLNRALYKDETAKAFLLNRADEIEQELELRMVDSQMLIQSAKK